jgi:hypothetical protein
MIRSTKWLMGGLASAMIWPAAIAKETAHPKPPTIESLGFLAGSWSGTTGDRQWEACYTTPAGGEILSVNKEMRDGSVVMIEFERFRVVDGNVVMTPYPFGKMAAVSFTLTRHDPQARLAEFANPQHDFPQRLVYHRVADDRLRIDIFGEQRGNPVSQRIDLRRR